MTYPSPAAAHSRFAIVAAACLVAAACSDRAPTSPTSALQPGATNADRSNPTYDYATIDVPGALGTSPQGVNAGGDVAGLYVDATGKYHGFVLSGGAFTTIDYPGADYTDVRGIGPDGSVVGTHAMNSEPAVAYHGFKRTPDGQFTTVHFPGHSYEIPQRILPDGTILGCRHDWDLMVTMRGIQIDPSGSANEIDAFASMSNGAAPSGHRVVGLWTNMMTKQRQGFVIDDGVFTPFMVPGSAGTSAWDVNPRGDIIGTYRDGKGVHGFVRPGGGDTYVTLDFPGATSTSALGIDARGDVVGSYVASGVTHGFLAMRQ